MHNRMQTLCKLEEDRKMCLVTSNLPHVTSCNCPKKAAQLRDLLKAIHFHPVGAEGCQKRGKRVRKGV